MNKIKQGKIREGRLEIVAQLYKRGYTLRAIRTEVMRRLGLATYSLQTVHRDIKALLQEWKESRIGDIDDYLELERTRIDDTVRELWEQWEKSKEDYTKTERKRKGAPANSSDNGNNGEGGIRTFSVEESTKQVVMLGDPAYIAEIRQQLMERRKLLGLYAPEKRDIQGGMSFAAFLMESGMIDEAEKEAGLKA